MKTEPLRLIRATTYATLVVTCLALCLPYVRHREWLWALTALWLFAIAIPVPDLPPWGRVVSNVTFAGTVILAGNAAARLGRPFLALIAVAAATATWDLQHLIHRLRPFEPATQKSPASESAPISESAPTSEPAPISDSADSAVLDRRHSDARRPARSAPPQERTIEEPDARSTLIRAHLQRLATTLGISLALGSLALVIRVDYNIRTLAALTLVLLVGLGGAVAYLRRASD